MKGSVDIDWPWCTDEYEKCSVIHGTWVPIIHLASMLQIPKKDLCHKWAAHIVKQLEGGGYHRNFVRISDLAELLAKEGWDAEKIEKGLKFFEEPVAAPLRKRSVESDEDAAAAGGTRKISSRRRDVEEQMPPWARDFMDECRKTVGEQAINRFMESEEYMIRCKEAVALKMKQLDDELRKKLIPEIKKELKEQYKIETRQEHEREQKERQMQRFRLMHNPEVNTALTAYAFEVRNNTAE